MNSRVRRGQASVELLIILALSLIVLTGTVFAAYTQLSFARSEQRLAVAQASLNSLAEAVDAVASEGVGSKRLVRFSVPEAVASERVFVDGRIANLGVFIENGISDVNILAGARMQGTLPNISGQYDVWVVAREGFVFVGDVKMVPTPATVVTQMERNAAKSELISFSNSGSESIIVDLSLNWSAGGASASVSPTQLAVPAFSSRNASVSFSSGSSLGVYSGSIDASASNGEKEKIELVVYVVE